LKKSTSILSLICLFWTLLLVTQSAFADEALSESALIKAAVEEDFQRFIKAAWQRKESYGFHADDRIEAVTLDRPVCVFGIDENLIENIVDVDNLVSNIRPVGEWMFPVMAHGEYRTLFGVRKHEYGWKGVYLGNPYLAHAVEKLRRAWSLDGEDSFKLVSCVSPRSFWFIVTSVSMPNLTPLTMVELGPDRKFLPPEDFSMLTPASDAASALKDYWYHNNDKENYGLR
jgi:hypothetical protein